MGSSRLPGKVLQEINGKPMLQRVVDRVSRASLVDEVIVATTVDPSDDPVAGYCQTNNILHTRGSLYDVLDRYYQTARQYQADIVVRITGDCPVIDPVEVDHVVQVSRETGADFTSNRLPPPWGRSYPIGLDTEVCSRLLIEQAWRRAAEKHQREHVMPYFYEGVELQTVNSSLATGISTRGFHIALLNHEPDYGRLRWTVDTPEDLEFIRQVFDRFDGRDDFSWQDILKLLKREPRLADINFGVAHKKLFDIDERT
ncbi:MAG: glycosyltransferase family protein [Anaerolineales bacterium]|nr:glycosyltransferase family protein [Anaerolineales bacterium]